MDKQGNASVLNVDDDILALIGSDMCESIRDLIYSIKVMKSDIEDLKKKLI